MSDSPAPIANRRIRIALVGCGRISANHIRSIAVHSDRAELVAICDVNPEQLEKTKKIILETADEYPASAINPQCFASFSALLQDYESKVCLIDLVVFATPSGLHPNQVILAAKAGLNVCTEKPMATRFTDGLAMVKACDEAGVYLFVVKQNRFNTTLQLVKRQLENRRFGRLSMIAVNVFWQRPQSYYDQDRWRGTWEFDGGALMNQASHYVDLMQWLIGPVQSISASIASIGRDIEAEDTAALQLKWRNGALGTMAVSMLTYPKNLEGSITILGDKGTVKIGGSAVNKIEHWRFDTEHSDDELVDQASYDTTSVYGFGHPQYYINMLDTLQGLCSPLCDGREGMKSLELITAAYISSRDNKVVGLPLNL